MEKIGENFPIRTYRTSFTKNDGVLSSFLAKHQPAGVLNLIGGLSAAILIYAEQNGISAAHCVTVVDSHYVTSEILQGFAPIVNEAL